MLKEFVDLVESDEDIVNVADLFSKADKRKWSKWISIFETIRIDNVASGLREVQTSYKLNKTEEITLLAYVKFLELMINSVGRLEKEENEAVGKDTVSPVSEVMYG